MSEEEIPVNTIMAGDATDRLEELPDESVDMCMTSPPYFQMRDYQISGQIGLEDTLDEYAANLLEVFQQVRRVLKPDGTFFLNIGDSYQSTAPGTQNTESNLNGETAKAQADHYRVDTGLPPKCMMMVPERVMFALVEQGWVLRNKVIWRKKGGGMPESISDRFSTTWEYLYMFSKQSQYHFDLDAVREPYAESTKQRISQNNGNPVFNGRRDRGHPDGADTLNVENFTHPNGKNPGDLWRIATAQFPDAHFAVFPEELCERPIKAGCPRKGVVLDPFAGAGTTCVAAKKLNRKYIGIELNPEYAEMARDRIRMECGETPIDEFIQEEN